MNLSHITIIVTDLERSKAFYKALGLKQLVDTPPRYARFTTPEGASTLSVGVDAAVTGTPGAVQIFFECADVDAAVTRAKDNGAYVLPGAGGYVLPLARGTTA
jgi:hydroxymethylpyrimidine/phosphomethylpyrimidine kinase